MSQTNEETALARASCLFGPCLATTALGFLRYTQERGRAAIGMPAPTPEAPTVPTGSAGLGQSPTSLPEQPSASPGTPAHTQERGNIGDRRVPSTPPSMRALGAKEGGWADYRPHGPKSRRYESSSPQTLETAPRWAGVPDSPYTEQSQAASSASVSVPRPPSTPSVSDAWGLEAVRTPSTHPATSPAPRRSCPRLSRWGRGTLCGERQ